MMLLIAMAEMKTMVLVMAIKLKDILAEGMELMAMVIPAGWSICPPTSGIYSAPSPAGHHSFLNHCLRHWQKEKKS